MCYRFSCLFVRSFVYLECIGFLFRCFKQMVNIVMDQWPNLLYKIHRHAHMRTCMRITNHFHYIFVDFSYLFLFSSILQPIEIQSPECKLNELKCRTLRIEYLFGNIRQCSTACTMHTHSPLHSPIASQRTELAK